MDLSHWCIVSYTPMLIYSSCLSSPMSSDAFLPFWVSWDGGTIRVGAGDEVNVDEFLTFTDPSPTQINYIGLGSCCGASVDWIIIPGN